MKKLFSTIALISLFGLIATAQVNPHAIGLRFGGGSSYGGEISYQQGMGDANRLELDLGFGGNADHNRMYLAGIYHWDWNITAGLNWFVGPGASVGFYHYGDNDGYINVALGGQIGLEYDFNTLAVPILLSLDARPMWDFLGDNSGLGWGAALGIRYTF
ncbi:MAG: hypothetical protein PHH30_02275 [Bacteroidales bacterium]|nr:hypothetical protein [Bacteroidales bacterium]